MTSTSINGSGALPLYIQIKRDGTKEFIFVDQDEDGNETDHTVTGDSWELFIKRYAGDRDSQKVLSLTTPSSGLSFRIYETNIIDADWTYLQTDLPEGQYYWELYNITEKRTYISDKCYLSYEGVR